MANTHHTGIPKLQWSFNYPPCTPSVTIVADKNPFCLGDSVTFTPTFTCVDDVTITAYGWVVNGSIQSTSAEPFVTNTLTNGNSVYTFFITSTGQTYFSNVITMQEKTEGCPTLIKYGLLYNWYAVTDARNITSSDTWVVPLYTEIQTLYTYLGGTSVAGGKLKEMGITYWETPNTGATNQVGFNSRGNGVRALTAFSSLNRSGTGWCRNQFDANNGYVTSLGTYNNTSSTGIFDSKYRGRGLRLFRTATEAEQLLADGTPCQNYVGNDGKIYRTVKIGTQVWLADNLLESKYRDGSLIPIVEDNTTWANLTTGACCYYNNDSNNG